MRYEDMIAAPHETFGDLARHLLMRPTKEQLSKALELSSFERLKQQESDAGFREKPKDATQFFREGRSGQWREILTERQIRQIVSDHHVQMRRFGYLPS
jgi:hypothetical protein